MIRCSGFRVLVHDRPKKNLKKTIAAIQCNAYIFCIHARIDTKTENPTFSSFHSIHTNRALAQSIAFTQNNIGMPFFFFISVSFSLCLVCLFFVLLKKWLPITNIIYHYCIWIGVRAGALTFNALNYTLPFIYPQSTNITYTTYVMVMNVGISFQIEKLTTATTTTTTSKKNE